MLLITPALSPLSCTCTRSLYLKLQRIYRDKAEADIAAVEAHVQTILQRLGREPSEVPREQIRLVCRNARNLRMVR